MDAGCDSLPGLMAMPIEKIKKVVDMATRGGTEGERDYGGLGSSL